MAKIRTMTQLQEVLDQEMGWRIKEISTLKIAAKSAGTDRMAFVRAGIALVYAHWEGFVKAASEAYLNYVDNQGHLYRDLKSCFAVVGLKGRLHTLTGGRKAVANIEAFDFVFGELDKPSKMRMSSAIDTESNLTSKVFANIAATIDIATTAYETRYNLIDESLVSRRNKVAHGEYLDVEVAGFLTLADEVVQLLRNFKTDIQNSATQESYKRPSPVAASQAGAAAS